MREASTTPGSLSASLTQVGFVGNDARGVQLLIPPGGDAPGVTVACEGINNIRQVVCGLSDINGNTVGEFIGTPDGNDQ